jgi:hypothetical protein
VVAGRQLDEVEGSGGVSLRFPCPDTDTDPPQLPTSANRILFLVPVTLALFSFGCPSSAPTPITIQRVVYTPDPDASTIQVFGSGFGPTSVNFDLSNGRGNATVDLTLEIDDSDPSDQPVVVSGVSVLSSAEIDGQLVGNPLKPGIDYYVRLMTSQGTKMLARSPVFRVMTNPNTQDNDSGMDMTPDATDMPPDDTGGDMTDAGVSGDTGSSGPDGQANGADAVPGVDVGAPDSGLGPFVGNFTHRQAVIATNNTALVAPANTTIAVTVPLKTLSNMGLAKPNGSDVALYLGSTMLDSQFDDPANLATDQVLLIATVPQAVNAGASITLALYFGDPNTTLTRSDAIYLFAERFLTDVPAGTAAPNWKVNGWTRCDKANPPTAAATSPGGGAYCYPNTGATLQLRTLASPNVTQMTSTQPANLTYEVGFGVAGKMVQTDLVYFAYGESSFDVINTVQPTVQQYVATTDVPNIPAQMFTDNNNAVRTVNGWRFLPAGTAVPFARARVRFTPVAAQTAPALHFRYVGPLPPAADDSGSYAAIDDLTVRLALDPEWAIQPGAIESR